MAQAPESPATHIVFSQEGPLTHAQYGRLVLARAQTGMTVSGLVYPETSVPELEAVRPNGLLGIEHFEAYATAVTGLDSINPDTELKILLHNGPRRRVTNFIPLLKTADWEDIKKWNLLEAMLPIEGIKVVNRVNSELLPVDPAVEGMFNKLPRTKSRAGIQRIFRRMLAVTADSFTQKYSEAPTAATDSALFRFAMATHLTAAQTPRK